MFVPPGLLSLRDDVSSRRGNEHVAALPETGPSTAKAVVYEWTAKQRK